MENGRLHVISRRTIEHTVIFSTALFGKDSYSWRKFRRKEHCGMAGLPGMGKNTI